VIVDASEEYPPFHWMLGALIFAAFFYQLKNNKRKNDLISFSLIMFGVIFITTSVVGGSVAGLFADHWWGTMSLYPGVILCSHMLINLKEKYKFGKFIMIALSLYFLIHAFYFIKNSKNYEFVIPINRLCIERLDKAEYYLQNGNVEKAVDLCKWIEYKSWGRNEKVYEKAREILYKYDKK